MLAFLDALCQALCARDGGRIRLHLHHPLARALPPAVRAEALAIARAGESGQMAPTRALRFYYQTLQLLATPERTEIDEAMFEFRRTVAPASSLAITR